MTDRAGVLSSVALSAIALPLVDAPVAGARALPDRLAVTVAGVTEVRSRTIVLAREPFRISGRVGRLARGERVMVRVFRGERNLAARYVKVRDGGRFSFPFAVRRPGRISVKGVVHLGPEKVVRARARSSAVEVAPPAPRHGSRSPIVAVLQRRLAAMGYRAPRSGVLDDATERAVLAYRATNRLRRTPELSARVTRRILSAAGGAFVARSPDSGRHIEADLTRNIVALVEADGRPSMVVHTSHGKKRTPTVVGTFRFFRKEPGRNATGMVDSNYFHRGYAIHGYRFVPLFPDSHGCLRVDNADIPAIDRWIRIGDRIDVYRSGTARAANKEART